MHFLGYRIDAVHHTVTAPGGRVVRLEPKAFDVLAFFAAHPQELLSRDRLIAEVWGGKFVTDDAVMVAVYALRQAFDDDPRAPRFIETLRGRGYRWIASQDAATPTRRPWTAVAVPLIVLACGSVFWVGLRARQQPMPSLTKTSELVRAHARGAFFLERATRDDLEKARTEFRKAIRIDERFAEPHAALAEVCVRMIELGAGERQAIEDEARREAERAIELAPQLALSRAAQASVQFVLDRDVAGAERSFRTAIELDPSLPGIHRRYSYLLGASGRFPEAMEQARIATELQPASPGAIGDLAWTYVLAGRLDDAERLYRDAVELDPTSTDALFAHGYCLELRNAPGAAMESYRRVMQIRGLPAEAIARYDKVFAASGMPGVYAAMFERMRTNDSVPRVMLASGARHAVAGRTSGVRVIARSTRVRRAGGVVVPDEVSRHPVILSRVRRRRISKCEDRAS